jgi:hypothetical protein
MDQLWLGYDDLTLRCADVAAILHYHAALDRRIALAYGRVPPSVRAVVVTADGSYWPSRWRAEQLRRRLASWRGEAAG